MISFTSEEVWTEWNEQIYVEIWILMNAFIFASYGPKLSLTGRLVHEFLAEAAQRVWPSAAALLSTAGTEWPPQGADWTAASSLRRSNHSSFFYFILFFYSLQQQNCTQKVNIQTISCVFKGWVVLHEVPLSWIRLSEIHQFNFSSKLDLRSNYCQQVWYISQKRQLFIAHTPEVSFSCS